MITAEQIQRLCDAAAPYKFTPQTESRSGWQPLGFTMEVGDDIKDAILQELGLDLSAVHNVPFRWITGDTEVHTDCTTTSFANTYMIYLTDSSGEFIVDGKQAKAKQLVKDVIHAAEERGLLLLSCGTYDNTLR
jgi:hypothetical protein